MPLKYYELKLVTVPDSDEPMFATAALIMCGLCGICIDSSGGPGNGVVCISCGDRVRNGQARGSMKQV